MKPSQTNARVSFEYRKSPLKAGFANVFALDDKAISNARACQGHR